MAKIEKVSDEYAAEKAAAAKAKSELTRKVQSLTAQIEETWTRAEADVAERRAAAVREARAEVDKVKSDLERLNVELGDAKTAAATAIAAAESRELTLTRRINTLEEECEQRESLSREPRPWRRPRGRSPTPPSSRVSPRWRGPS